MTKKDLYEYFNINGKDVYVVEEHHHVLLPWAFFRRDLRSAPNLITLDHHTDTLEAFMRYRHAKTSKNMTTRDDELYKAMLPQLVAALDWGNDRAVTQSIQLLRNDEHISAALLAGILELAFSFNLSSDTTSSIEENNWRKNAHSNRIHGVPYPEPPFSFTPSSDNIFKISATCAVDCEGPHENACIPYHYSQVVESSYLERGINRAQEMYASMVRGRLLDAPYILDIDLDYFHSEESVHPRDPTVLHRLIQGAVGITLATEPSFVEEGRIQGSKIDSNYLLKSMMEHIENALTDAPGPGRSRGRAW